MEEMNGTKLRIFETAIRLFSQDSYQTVSLRDIARECSIKAPSIYNHFSSKDAILQAIFDYFDQNMNAIMPDLDDLLALVETAEPHTVLRETTAYFSPTIMPLMARAMLITCSLVLSDNRADRLVNKNLIELPFQYDPPVLRKMMAMDKIHPINVDSLSLIHSSFCHSAAIKMYSNHLLSNAEWTAGLDMIFSLVKVK